MTSALSAPPLLAVTGLRKRYGERLLFDIERLVIRQGSAYVLTGWNGAGKTTLLRILAGLEPAEWSGLSFLGETLRLSPYPPALRAAIVYVHQHPVMFSGSVAANIGYGLAARGRSRAEIAQRVQEALEWAGLARLHKADAQTLSGGEKQRVALARARVLDPQLLLLDEPTSSLDGAAREQVIKLIPGLTASGASIVMACHDRDLISLPGVQRLKLSEGRLQARQNRMRAVAS